MCFCLGNYKVEIPVSTDKPGLNIKTEELEEGGGDSEEDKPDVNIRKKRSKSVVYRTAQEFGIHVFVNDPSGKTMLERVKHHVESGWNEIFGGLL